MPNKLRPKNIAVHKKESEATFLKDKDRVELINESVVKKNYAVRKRLESIIGLSDHDTS